MSESFHKFGRIPHVPGSRGTEDDILLKAPLNL